MNECYLVASPNELKSLTQVDNIIDAWYDCKVTMTALGLKLYPRQPWWNMD